MRFKDYPVQPHSMGETYGAAFRCRVFKKKKLAVRNNKSEGMSRTIATSG
jgi:hypothetical protein